MTSFLEKFLRNFLSVCFLISILWIQIYAKDSPDKYLDSAAAFKESMEYDKAIEVLEEALKENNDIGIKKYLGKLCYLDGRLSIAKDIFDNLRDKDWQIFIYQGLICEEMGRERQAIDNYLKSIGLRNNSIALYRLGKLYYHKKDYSKAVEFFSDTIDLDSSIRLAYYYLGDCFLKTKDYKNAYNYLAKSVNFYPQKEEIKEKLIKVKEKLGEDFFAKKERMLKEDRKKVKLPAYVIEEGIPLVKVEVAKELTKFSFRCGGEFTLTDGIKVFRGQANRFYTVALKNRRLALYDYETSHLYMRLGRELEISSSDKGGNYPFHILGVIYGKSDFWRKEMDRVYRGNFEVISDNSSVTLINILSVEEYLYGVLPSEIGIVAGYEALKAQAVAARTNVFKNIGRHNKEGFDFCADVHCQVYQGMSAESAYTTMAVKETRGDILVYKDEPIEALFHSNCGGFLRSDAFSRRPYLADKLDYEEKAYSPESPYQQEEWFFDTPETFCSNLSGSKFRWQRVYDKDDFLFIFGFPLDKLKGIRLTQKGEGFHYKAIEVVTANNSKQRSPGKKEEKVNLEGDLRIRDYFDKLRSSAFKLEIKFSSKRVPNTIIFWGAGFGHGSGLCQEGAMNMADKGYSYQEILKHYYPHTLIKKLY